MTGLDIRIVERALHFKQPAGTSRGVLTEKPSFYVIARDLEEDGRIGIGECSLIPGLSPERAPRARMELKKLAALKKKRKKPPKQLPALRHWRVKRKSLPSNQASLPQPHDPTEADEPRLKNNVRKRKSRPRSAVVMNVAGVQVN